MGRKAQKKQKKHIFLKKLSEKFVQTEKMYYLCTRK